MKSLKTYIIEALTFSSIDVRMAKQIPNNMKRLKPAQVQSPAVDLIASAVADAKMKLANVYLNDGSTNVSSLAVDVDGNVYYNRGEKEGAEFIETIEKDMKELRRALKNNVNSDIKSISELPAQWRDD